MSKKNSTESRGTDVFGALASQLQYQKEIGGVPLSPDQQMLLGTYLAERRDGIAADAAQPRAESGRPQGTSTSRGRAGSSAGSADRAEPAARRPGPAAQSTNAEDSSGRSAQATTEPVAKPPVSSKRHYSGGADGDEPKKRSKRRGSGLPSVESFVSKTTGRLPWQEPEAKPGVESEKMSSLKSRSAEEKLDQPPRSEPSVVAPKSPDAEPTPSVAAPTPSDSENGPSEVSAEATDTATLHEPAQTPPSGSQSETLEDIREALGDCTRCGLSESRTNIVFGVGNPRARLMFIGEAPGYYEDQKAEPFVGKAGQLLDKMIVAMGLSRDEVYISNVLKCRPPDNRNPHGDEVAHCSPFLKRQILSVDPDVIITLGKFAATFVLGREVRITQDRGRWQEAYGRPVMPTFHPSYLLRKPESKRDAWQDLQAVMAKLGLDGANS